LSKNDCRLPDPLVELRVVKLKQPGTLISGHAEQQAQNEGLTKVPWQEQYAQQLNW